MRTIEDEITEILRFATMSQGTNLAGFYYDLEAALSRRNYLANVKARTTDDPRCLLIATGDATSNLSTAKKIADYLVKLWLEGLCYQDFEAHEIISAPQSVTLRFITKANELPLCVTGTIVITHNHKDD
jgi:hypothetical protein